MPHPPRQLETFAIAAPGLEEMVANELTSIGIAAAAEPGGASWTAGLEELYRANLQLRTASRVVVRVARFRARSFIELERHARRIDWVPWLGGERRVELRVTSRKSKLYHEGAISERFARWIAEETGAAAIPTKGDETEEPDPSAQLFVIRFLRDECTISVDSSGELLHRRGYRQALARAPLRENLAAALLQASGWKGDVPLIDPLCGSGTIPIEGALLARRIAPGLARENRIPRNFAFERWSDFDPILWNHIVEEGRRQIRPESPVAIVGSDRDEGAIEAARANAERAGVQDHIHFEVRAVSRLSAPPAGGRGGLVAVNPPYGVRIGEAKSLRNLYAALGSAMRERLPDWRLAMISANEELDRQVGRELRETFVTSNGGIRVRGLVG